MTVTGHVLRSTRAIVDLSAIGSNIATIRTRIGPHRRLMAVVKADGYGHGAIAVAQTALAYGADYLGVALPEEGQALRAVGIEVPILVLGLIQPDEAYKVVESDLDQTVCSMPLLEALNSEAKRSSKKVNIHLKVDTGMGRIGVKPNGAVSFAKRVQRYENLNLVGVFSHFSTADSMDKTFARTQLQHFNEVLDSLDQADIQVAIRHIANSAAVLDMPEAYLDMVRPGIMIYGLYPSNQVTHSITLEPVMTLVTKVIAIKTVPAGASISYGRTFITAKKETTIATLPLGYGDGLSRLSSNKIEVLIKNKRAPLVGTICMDMCMVDVSGVKDVKCGDQVTIFGKDPSVEELAEKIGTINYEVTCNVSKRVPRVYIPALKGGKRIMPKILILYHSITGNTKAMSEAVEAGVRKEGVEVVCKRLEDATVDELPHYDGIILGTPTYFASASAEIKQFIDESIKYYKKLEGKVGAAFSSSGDLGGGNETAVLNILHAFLVHGMIVPGYISGGHYGPVCVGDPNEKRKEACEKMGKTVAQLVKTLSTAAQTNL